MRRKRIFISFVRFTLSPFHTASNNKVRFHFLVLSSNHSNGGVIYPELHYGRDALVGTALFLTWLAHKGMTMTQLRATYPSYFASKNKIELTPAIDVDKVLREIKERYAGENMNDIDGVKIDFAENWVHLRKSNTEPIIRVYTEAKSMAEADALAQRFIGEIKEICNI